LNNLIVIFPIILKNGNGKDLHWPKIDNFATCLGEKSVSKTKNNNFVMVLLDTSKVEKSIIDW